MIFKSVITSTFGVVTRSVFPEAQSCIVDVLQPNRKQRERLCLSFCQGGWRHPSVCCGGGGFARFDAWTDVFFLQGGIAFVAIKGAFKVYFKQQQYLRQAHRKILNFPEQEEA